MEKVERREMKTERLNIKETLPIVRLKTHSACNYKYVILSKDLKTGSHVRCKCKRKRKWKCKRVHTFNENARKERYASAVEVFFQDGRQWLSRLPIHTCEKRTQIQTGKCFIIQTTVLYKDFQSWGKLNNTRKKKMRYFFTCVWYQLLTRYTPFAPLGQVDERTTKPPPFSIQGRLSEHFRIVAARKLKYPYRRLQRVTFKLP